MTGYLTKNTEELRTNNGKIGAVESAELLLLTTTGAKATTERERAKSHLRAVR